MFFLIFFCCCSMIPQTLYMDFEQNFHFEGPYSVICWIYHQTLDWRGLSLFQNCRYKFVPHFLGLLFTTRPHGLKHSYLEGYPIISRRVPLIFQRVFFLSFYRFLVNLTLILTVGICRAHVQFIIIRLVRCCTFLP